MNQNQIRILRPAGSTDMAFPGRLTAWEAKINGRVLVTGRTIRGLGVEYVHSWFDVSEVLDVLMADPAARQQVYDRVDVARGVPALQRYVAELVEKAF